MIDMFIRKIENGTLEIRQTQKKNDHSKYYIVKNKEGRFITLPAKYEIK